MAGVTAATAPLCLSAGADALVAGTAVFRGGAQAYAGAIAALRGEVADGDAALRLSTG